MFQGLKRDWQLARAKRLLDEVDDFGMRMISLPEVVKVRMLLSLAAEFKELADQTSGFQNVSDAGIKQLAQTYRTNGRSIHPTDMGRGNALFILSAWLESTILPGADAETSRALTRQLIRLSIEAADDGEKIAT